MCSGLRGGELVCTLTVVTSGNTYRMAMNRDEKISRGAGTPPEMHELDSTRAIYPNDGDGGTWISANQLGITLALLNWNQITPHVKATKTRSRGRVIPALIGSRSLSGLRAALNASNFIGMMPFRLVGIFPLEQAIWEWRWDSKQLKFLAHGWAPRHWFSSSLSDDRAESMRGAVCQTARHEPDAGSAGWLRRLHGSHVGGRGPFSLCVHREQVRTLSYSEVSMTPEGMRMCHFRGSPCVMNQIDPIEITIDSVAGPNLAAGMSVVESFESCLSQ